MFRKATGFLAIVATLIFTVNSSAAVVDLVTNGSFESGPTGTAIIPQSWSAHRNAVDVLQHASYAADGVRGLQLGNSAIFQITTHVLVPGQTYTLKDNGTNFAGGGFYYTFMMSVPSGATDLSASSTLAYIDHSLATPAAFPIPEYEVSYTATAADAGRLMTVYINSDTGARALDNVRVLTDIVPEPGSIGFAAMLCAGGLFVRRR